MLVSIFKELSSINKRTMMKELELELTELSGNGLLLSEAECDELLEHDIAMGCYDGNGADESEKSRLLRDDTDQSGDEQEYTLEEAIDALGFGWFQLRIASIVGFQSLVDALEIMLVSVLSDKLMCEWRLLAWQQALLTTVVFGGYFLSAPVWGMVADKFGRKKCLGLCSFYIFYFGALSAFSPNFTWILILRGMVGLSLGGASQGTTVLAEFMPSKTRGLALVFIGVFWITGVCLEITLALIIMPTLGWRYLMLVSSIPMLIFLALLKFCPESMLYQQTCGDFRGIALTLQKISRMNKRPLPPGTLKTRVQATSKGSIAGLFKTRSLAITTSMLFVIWFSAAFLYYGMILLSTELFSSGQTCASEPTAKMACYAACKSLDNQGYLNILLTSFAEFPGNVVTFFTIECIGRKMTMGVQLLIASLFTFLLALCTTGPVQIVFVFIVRAMVGGSFQALYVYTPEVYPTHIRAVSLGVCVASSRLGAIVTPFIAQVLIRESVIMTLVVYGSFALLSGVLTLLLPLETKGKILK